MKNRTGIERKWLVLAAMASGSFLAAIDGSIVNIALPVLEEQLNTQFTLIEWVVLAYLLTITTLMLSVGRLADMTGKKKLYLAGVIIFTTGSALCGLSGTVGMLIACRVLQGIGAACTMALGAAITTEAFPPSERGMALGLSGTMISLGAISGPILGGLILSVLSWHWIFFVNIPVGLAGVLLTLRYVPDVKPAGGETFDLPGAAAMFASLFCLLTGLTAGQDLGFTQPLCLGLLAAAAVFLAVFILVEKRAVHPLIDLSLFKNQLFSVNLTTGLMTFICSSGVMLLMPFYLEDILKYESGKIGLLMMAFPLTMGLTAPLAGSLSDRFGSRRLTVVGLAVLLLAYIGISTLSQETGELGYVLRFIPLGLGMGLFQSPNNSAVMGRAPRNRLGVASGLLSITRTTGQTVGIAVQGAIWAGWVRILTGAPIPDATTAPAVIQTAAMQRTFYAGVGLIAAALLLSLWALVRERASAGQPAGLDLPAGE